MVKFDYDEKNDDLFLYDSKSKSKGSVELGDLILDFDSKKNLVGIQFLNASIFIKKFSDKSVFVKQMLLSLTSCKFDAEQNNGFFIVKVVLESKYEKICPVFSFPSIKESSPAVAFG